METAGIEFGSVRNTCLAELETMSSVNAVSACPGILCI